MSATISKTAEVLAGMFTENTGRHFLDSGGAYGRNWERNQGKVVQNFLDLPEASIEVYDKEDWYLTRSTFHFLLGRLEWDEEWNNKLDEVAEAHPEDNWFAVAEMFIEWIKTDAEGEYHHPEATTITVNTYNHESSLDQVIQFTQINFDGDDACYPDLIVLQVHGGADVRGGYTAPVVFLACGDSEVGLLDDSDLNMSCEGSKVSTDPVLPGFKMPEVEYHSWHSDDAGYHWYGDGGGIHDDQLDRNNTEVDDDNNLLCPVCKSKLQAYAY